MQKHLINIHIIFCTLIAASFVSYAQTYSKRELVGKYQFKVTWMTDIETNLHLRRNGDYSIVEIFEGKPQKAQGSWYIYANVVILTTKHSTSTPLSVNDTIPIWFDSLNNVQLGNYKRSHNKARNNNEPQ